MKYNIRGNKIDVTEAIDNYIKEKLSRLDKYLDEYINKSINPSFNQNRRTKTISLTNFIKFVFLLFGNSNFQS